MFNLPVFPTIRAKKDTVQKLLNNLNAEGGLTSSVFTPPPLFDPNQSFGANVNLVNIVREHAPKRIAHIDHELVKLEQKIQVLIGDRKQLVAMVDALENATPRKG